MTSRRILYAGADHALAGLLRDALKTLDCFVVRSPVPTARTLIESYIKYTLLLFDDDPSGAELETYTRALRHREHTPIIIVKKSEELAGLLNTIRRALATTRAP
ncbi:MAG TPA: hypothetical protein VF588_11560 [Pyrinomonadaceae bacterium]|jgi:hypothetical protein